MARKPPDWRQPSLFPPHPGNTPEPDNATQQTEGESHAVQDHHPRNAATANGTAQPAAEGPQAVAGNGDLRPRAEDQPRGLEGSADRAETGERPEPDRQRSSGDSTQGNGGSFAHRISQQRAGGAVPGRSNGVHPPSHVARLKASRQRSLFDFPPEQAEDTPPSTDPPAKAPEPRTIARDTAR